jgi:murein L,D-transpeptidase YafK
VRLLAYSFSTVVLLALCCVILLPNETRGLFSRLNPFGHDISDIRDKTEPSLQALLETKGLVLGLPAHIRIFKEERALEVWLKSDGAYHHFKTYEICNYSGHLGPKLREGDHQSPEGFYRVDLAALNPNSAYHLSFNLGFPNQLERSLGRTGSYLMVHGNCVSIGCYAMTDAGIEEIYLLVEAALNGGQEAVGVHAYPFRMTSERLAQEAHSPWFEFWKNLQEGYGIFETYQRPALVSASNTGYAFTAPLAP